ncbi:MAG TPA: hypothetical protein VMT24_19100 [Aggregatilineaceae bacterium]|nr:hypothetical protein [Aggregatilineaceae bacterium]
MTHSAPLSKREVEQLVVNWYRDLDVHRPLGDVLQYISEAELEMVLPETTVRDLGEAEQLLQNWYHSFFDEVHTLLSLDTTISPGGQRADVRLVVRWEASRWKAPAAKSERLIMDAYQTWIVTRSAASGKPVITGYVVNELKLMPGSASL